MKNKYKTKIALSIIFMLIGVAAIIASVTVPSLSESQSEYISGFGSALLFVEALMLIKMYRIYKNPEVRQKAETAYSDERLKVISEKSMSAAFRISVLAEAILSLALTFFGNEGGRYLGLAVCFQLIIYLLFSVYISKKM